MWVAAAGLNAVIAICYFTIAAIILLGVVRQGALRTNLLATATGAIFITCAVHHGSHTVHMVLPLAGLEVRAGTAMRTAMDWHSVAWDALGAAVAIYYLTLRRTYGALLGGPQMFEGESERRRRTTLEALEEGVIVQDATGAIADFNPAAARILGLTEDQLLGRAPRDPAWQELHPDGSPWPSDATPVATSRRTGEPVHGESMGIRRADGSVVWLSVSTAPITTSAGRLTEMVVTFSDITERVEAAAHLRWRAFHDELSALPNRSFLLERLNQSLAGSRRTGKAVTVLFCDLDHFKVVNDSLGHVAGDQVLMEVAERLRHAVRPADTVARLGGDEFVILAEDATMTDARLIAERIRAALERPVVLPTGDAPVIGVSIGIATTTDQPAEDLLRDADTALYRAKSDGRSRYEFFTDALRSEAVDRLEAEQVIRTALDAGTLGVAYQPILEIATGALHGAEALLRIPTGGARAYTTARMVAIAEDTGLIVPVGGHVLTRSCQQMRQWRDDLGALAPARIAVNVAARQLGAPGFVELVTGALDAAGLAPNTLCLELTEAVLIGAARSTRRTVERLHDTGVTFALDDFGTGWSSMTYLKRFPVDYIKIDQSFVAGVDHSGEDRAIVRAVIDLGHDLNIRVVAEGVETAGQLDVLHGLGCDLGQGFYLCAPRTPDDFLLAIRA